MKRGMIREELFQIERKKRRKVQNYLIKIGLTPGQGQARILRYLKGHNQVTQRELADSCGLDVTTMSRTLDRMEQSGYLIRSRNPECRRSYQVDLTELGYEKAEEVFRGFEQLEMILCRNFTKDEKNQLLSLLERIEDNLDTSEEIW